jgi:NADPH:quinone reductase-like Zn-dependent oxidoreductase
VAVGDAVDPALHGRLVLILPSYGQGTWADRVTMASRNVIPLRGDVDPLQLAMLGVNGRSGKVLFDFR